jgi:predicted flap endonuclease-1-like 5' DNA nuclease
VNRQLEGLDEKIMQTVADEVPGLQDSIQQNLKIQLESQIADLQQSLTGEIDAKTASLRADLLQADQALKTELTQEVGLLISTSEQNQLNTLNNSLAGLSGEFDAKLQAGLDEVRGTIRTQANQVVAEQLAKGVTLSDDSKSQLLKELDGVIDQKVELSISRSDPAVGGAVVVEDFTVMKGVGETYDSRLKAADINNYAQLAELSPEEIAEVTRMPLSQVLENDLVGQAKKLSTTS